MPQPVSQATLAPGSVLAKRYKIDALIGSGGYASVYRAIDQTFGYERAIKEVTDLDPGVRQQFQLESELLINTKHDNVPHGYNLFEDRGRMYLVMEYIHGKDLEELLNESLTQHNRALDEAQVLAWMIDICDALTLMHGLKVPIIHRDIKPANIKITPDGRPVLIDFGLAKLQKAGRPTMTAAQGVSPGFAPPEQYMAKGRTDGRTDVYGVGATLYACLTGIDPPEAPARLLAQTGATGMKGAKNPGALKSPRAVNSRVSEATDRLVMRALELSPTQRQPGAQALKDDLRVALQRLGGGAQMGMGSPAPSSGGKRRPSPPPAFPSAPGSSTARGTGMRPIVQPMTPAAGVAFGAAAGRAVGVALDARTGQQPSIPPGTGKQRAVQADRPTGRQQAVRAEPSFPPGGQLSATTGAVPTAAALRDASMALPALPKAGELTLAPAQQGPQGARAPNSGRGRSMAPALTTGADGATSDEALERAALAGAWVRTGTVRVGGFGAWMLALSAVEVLWGLVIVTLGGLTLTTQGKPPLLQFGLVWAGVVVLFSLLGGQALTRPIFRRGNIGSVRRGFQGMLLTLLTVAVHAVAIWGATIFATAQGNAGLAIFAFLLFGLNVLVLGIFSILNCLG